MQSRQYSIYRPGHEHTQLDVAVDVQFRYLQDHGENEDREHGHQVEPLQLLRKGSPIGDVSRVGTRAKYNERKSEFSAQNRREKSFTRRTNPPLHSLRVHFHSRFEWDFTPSNLESKLIGHTDTLHLLRKMDRAKSCRDKGIFSVS